MVDVLAAINSWTTAYFGGFLIILQIIAVLLFVKRDLDLKHLTGGYIAGTIFWVLTRNYWLGISAQIAGGS